MNYGRTAIEVKLEPAARAVAALAAADDAMRPALSELRDVIRELDEFDTARDRKRLASKMLRDLRLKLVSSMPLTQTKLDRTCPGPGGGNYLRCRNDFRAAWQLPNGEAFCKKDAESRRGALIRAAIEEAHGSTIDFYAERALNPEDVQAIAEKLGVSLEDPTVPA